MSRDGFGCAGGRPRRARVTPWCAPAYFNRHGVMTCLMRTCDRSPLPSSPVRAVFRGAPPGAPGSVRRTGARRRRCPGRARSDRGTRRPQHAPGAPASRPGAHLPILTDQTQPNAGSGLTTCHPRIRSPSGPHSERGRPFSKRYRFISSTRRVGSDEPRGHRVSPCDRLVNERGLRQAPGSLVHHRRDDRRRPGIPRLHGPAQGDRWAGCGTAGGDFPTDRRKPDTPSGFVNWTTRSSPTTVRQPGLAEQQRPGADRGRCRDMPQTLGDPGDESVVGRPRTGR
jgi:hypothetical protein